MRAKRVAGRRWKRCREMADDDGSSAWVCSVGAVAGRDEGEADKAEVQRDVSVRRDCSVVRAPAAAAAA